MATTPRDRMQRERDKIERLASEGTLDDRDAELALRLGVAMDDQKVRETYTTAEGETDSLQPRSIEKYLKYLRISAESGLVLTEASADEVNDLMVSMHDDEGKSKKTVNLYVAAMQAFYRNFDLGVDPEDIEYFSYESTPKYDENDIFEESDINALRSACSETKMPVRNRAFLELLVFTGQRLMALLTLKIDDVDLDGNRGYIYLNEEYAQANGGLKGATDRGLKRPVFGASKYLRDWMDYHPSDRDSDDWLFIPDRSHWRASDDDHWSAPAARQRLKGLKNTADVSKPVTAHNFRHYFATVMHRDYDLGKDSIRMLLGHKKDSKTLEQIYSHVFEEDHIREAEEALGYREPENRSPLTPDICPTCGEHLEEHWTQCPSCREEFGPASEIKSAADEVEEQGTELALEGKLTQEQLDGFRVLLDAVDDPAELAAALRSEE